MTTSTIPDLREIYAEVHRVNEANGWWEAERNFGELCWLMLSELAEAFEHYREHAPLVFYHEPKLRQDGLAEEDVFGNWLASSFVSKPDGVAVEIADCAIRAFDTLWQLPTDHLDFNAVVGRADLTSAEIPENLGQAFMRFAKQLVKAEHAEPDSPSQAAVHVLFVIVMCAELAAKLGCENFWEILQEKVAYNATRGYKHGGKVC
mgnify:CR=1 FL=1